jgi:hypothetical protein
MGPPCAPGLCDKMQHAQSGPGCQPSESVPEGRRMSGTSQIQQCPTSLRFVRPAMPQSWQRYHNTANGVLSALYCLGMLALAANTCQPGILSRFSAGNELPGLAGTRQQRVVGQMAKVSGWWRWWWWWGGGAHGTAVAHTPQPAAAVLAQLRRNGPGHACMHHPSLG